MTSSTLAVPNAELKTWLAGTPNPIQQVSGHVCFTGSAATLTGVSIAASTSLAFGAASTGFACSRQFKEWELQACDRSHHLAVSSMANKGWPIFASNPKTLQLQPGVDASNAYFVG